MEAPPDADPPALALVLMGELQRYRAQGGPIASVAQRFVYELDAAGARIDHEVRRRLAELGKARGTLEPADERWIRSQLPDIVRQVALLDLTSSAKGSMPGAPVSDRVILFQ